MTTAAARIDGDDAYGIGADGCGNRSLAGGAQCRITVSSGPARGIARTPAN